MEKDSKAGRAKALAPALEFNHAMIYSRDVDRALNFYRDRLGFKVIEDMEYHGRRVYARLRPRKGTATIAIHLLEPGATLPASDAIRLYFEVKNLRALCATLEKAGVRFSQLPKPMPWGWEHAYLNDPDGHEVSLYWAGDKRFRKSKIRS
jgi:catechol 2,3-dioxygenase-like lactoylglutathione lyase family enzyme